MTSQASLEVTASDILGYLAEDAASLLHLEQGGVRVPKNERALERVFDQASRTLRDARVHSASGDSRSRVDVAATEAMMIRVALLGVAAQAMTGLTRSIFVDHDLFWFLHELEGHARSQGNMAFVAEASFKKYELGRELVRHVLTSPPARFER